jgi:hypothetical protein
MRTPSLAASLAYYDESPQYSCSISRAAIPRENGNYVLDKLGFKWKSISKEHIKYIFDDMRSGKPKQ